MRKLLLALAIVFLFSLAPDALACSRCGTSPDGCDVCYESTGDGGIDCYISQGEYCTIIGPSECDGIGGSHCDGHRCPDEKWVSHTHDEPAVDDRVWRLASVEVIRPKA